MKKVLTTFAALLPVLVSAQVTFSTSLGTYSNLTNATLLSDTTLWDDPESDLNTPTYNVGFSVKGSTINNNTIYIGDGYIYFEGPSGNNGFYMETTGIDLMDRGNLDGMKALSPISAKVEGTTPNRVFKIEWKNFGFYGEFNDSNTMNDYGNVQIWINEKDGKVEYHYGELSIESAASHQGYGGYNVFAGVLDFNNLDFKGVSLTGDPKAPTTNSDWDGVISGFPESGRVYSFVFNLGASVAERQSQKIKVYPVPAADAIWAEVPAGKSTFIVFSMKGEKLMEGEYNATSGINISGLTKGMYTLSIVSENANYHAVFVK